MSENLIKKDCVDAIYQALNDVMSTDENRPAATLKQASDVYDALLLSLTQALAAGHSVSFTGVGKFYTKTMPARVGRNPRTGEQISVQESRKVMFRAFPSLRSQVSL